MKNRFKSGTIISPISIPVIFLLLLFALANCQNSGSSKTEDMDEFIEDLKRRTFNFFWEQVDMPSYGIPDRYPTRRFTSIAATGFGLTSYLIGVENNYITREEAAERVVKTLDWFWNSRQGPEESGISGYKGFYYHFLDYGTGFRYQKNELSTIDTGLLMAGILSCQSYFDGNNEKEQRIRNLADSLFLRVEWDWINGNKSMSMGYHPERGFIDAEWTGYNEAMILIIMAMASPTHPIHENAWDVWCETYEWDEFYGYEHLNFSPLFGHQYSHMYIDFRDIQDEYMKEKGIDYFENSKRATLSNRAYCIDNPGNFIGYSENIWGLTACDGPANTWQLIDGDSVRFMTYSARGASNRYINDDGTIAPTAAGGSVPFAPEECLQALYSIKSQYGDSIYSEYGFRDAFNLTYQNPGGYTGWYDIDYLGIDQGPILIQIQNYQSEFVWDLMKRNKYITEGLKRAGFTGGWLDNVERKN